MAALPSYEEHTQRWALEACADDPAMQAAFRAAGARDGWVAGLDVRAYCEREGLMQTASSNRGCPEAGPRQGLGAGRFQQRRARAAVRGVLRLHAPAGRRFCWW